MLQGKLKEFKEKLRIRKQRKYSPGLEIILCFLISLIKKISFPCSGCTLMIMTWTHTLSLDHRAPSFLGLDPRSTRMPRAKAGLTLTMWTMMKDATLNEEPQK